RPPPTAPPRRRGDYASTGGTRSPRRGGTSHTITGAVVGETIFEANERFLVNLSNPVNATLADAQGIGTITNDDAAPTLAVNDVTVTEGDTGSTGAVFTVTLTGATELPAAASFTTANGT